MKRTRISIVLLALVLCISMAACEGNPASNEGSDGASSASSGGDANGGSGGSDGAQIACVFGAGHAEGINDKAFIQDCWEGIKEFGDANGKTYAYYQPIDDSKQSFLDAYDTAIKNGAEVVLTVGNEPSDSLVDATRDNPDVKFISIEATGFEESAMPNHYSILMNATDAGWLAGVAAVREGYKSLGILPCVAIPPVDMWTWGYVQGANYAANKYGIEGITLQHHYLNNWSASPEIQATAASWYNSGVEVIQCNTAGGNTSIIAASDAAGAAVFGSDKDQFDEGETVVTSEVVFRKPIVISSLESAYDGSFPGGTFWLPGVEADAAGLAMDRTRFKNYTKEMYDEDYADLKNDSGGIRSDMITIYDIPEVDDMWDAVSPKYIEFINIE